MPIGPGKYDHWCTLVRESERAQGAIVIVIGGEKGGGFSVQGDAALTAYLPEFLEGIASGIRDTFKAGKP